MELNVVSFNIRCANDRDGNSIAERAPRLKKVLADCNADIIGLQEMVPEWEIYIRKYYEDEYEIFNKYRATQELEAAPILWKKDVFQCVRKGYFWLSDTPEKESKGWDELYDCYRICMWVILEHKASGKRICYMNTHFGFGDKGQVQSVELIRKYQQEYSEYPAFITGDFNMYTSSPAYKKMTEYFTDVNMATAKDIRPTYHGYNQGGEGLIDFCFADAAIRSVSYKRIDDLVDGKFPSDHYGILMVLDVE